MEYRPERAGCPGPRLADGLRGAKKPSRSSASSSPLPICSPSSTVPAPLSPLIDQRIVKRSDPVVPFSARLYREYLPLFPMAVENWI